jgi:hypothetical protein
MSSRREFIVLLGGATAAWPLVARAQQGGVGAARWHHCCRRHKTVPIVLVAVADPVGAGFVESMARPGGNATGFIKFEYSLSGKLLELLRRERITA